MAKSRIINTRFWVDEYTSKLDPIEKLLFLYFLTNPASDICGVYELPLKNVAIDTGIDQETVKTLLRRFKRDGKIVYKDGWVGIKNFIKHQTLNPKVLIGVNIGLSKAPKEMLDSLCIVYPYSIDSLSHLNSNSNPNSNSKTNTTARAESKPRKPKVSPQGAEVVKAFEEVDPKNKTFYGSPYQRKACDFLIEEYGLEKVLAAIKVLPDINRQKLYVRQITTPRELMDNWVKIINALAQDKASKKTSIAFT